MVGSEHVCRYWSGRCCGGSCRFNDPYHLPRGQVSKKLKYSKLASLKITHLKKQLFSQLIRF